MVEGRERSRLCKGRNGRGAWEARNAREVWERTNDRKYMREGVVRRGFKGLFRSLACVQDVDELNSSSWSADPQ